LSTNEGGTVVATLTTDTEFTVTAETAAGCSRDTTFTVRVLPAPEIQLAASESVVCPGDPVALRATQGTTYEWLSRPTLTVSPDDPAIATALPEVTTTYQVVGTNEQGCRDTAEVKIEVRTMPGVSSSDTAVCISSEPFLLSLQLPAGVSGTWSGEGLPPGSITPNGQFNPQVAGLSPNGHAVTFAYQTDDAFACSSSISLNVIVNPLPELSFDLPDVVCVNQPITLTNTTADDERLTYRWEVEGTEYTDRSPVHHFQQTAEATTIWLFTETPEGCIASTPRTIQVVEAPEPSFTKSVEPESLCGPLSVTFANESKGDLITYLWDFGNGETSTEANPGTIIFEPSVLGDTTYAVTLSVTNACTTLEFVDSVHVRPPPIANFLFEKDTICADYPIRIHNHSLGLAETYVWDFGLDNPILPLGANQEGTFRQAFPNPGDSDTTYLVTLTATNSCGTDQITRPLVVTPKTIEAFYNSNTTRGCGPLEVELTSNQERTGNQVMFVWGDGDTTQGPAVATHIYENPGIYYPKMIAQNGCNIDACGGPGDPDCGVAIVVYPTPIADFNADEQICISEELELINTSSDAVNSTWDLGDGRTFVGTQPPPFTYSQPGDYTITLTTTNQQGCRSAEKTRMVSVRPLPKPDFAISANPYCQADDVVIQNMSIGASAYQWKVDGLGVISTDQDLNYSFSAAGVYELTMVAFNGTEENSCSDQLTRTIRVSRQAEPGFYYTRTFGCGGDSVIFTNNTRYPLPEDGVFEWDFGNGETYSGSGSVPPQLYLYPPQGTVASYNVTLTVHTEGCDSVFRQTIDVNSAAGVVLPEGDKPLAFTPTALNNNQFRLNYVQVTDIDLRIFSREGVEVFQTHDPGEAWDGYYRGELAPAGLYNVQVAYQDCTGGRGSTSLQLYLILEDF
jgi:PKD repeat protein